MRTQPCLERTLEKWVWLEESKGGKGPEKKAEISAAEKTVTGRSSLMPTEGDREVHVRGSVGPRGFRTKNIISKGDRGGPLGEAGTENKPGQCLTALFRAQALCFQSIKSFHPDRGPHLLMEADGQRAGYSKVTQLGQAGWGFKPGTNVCWSLPSSQTIVGL